MEVKLLSYNPNIIDVIHTACRTCYSKLTPIDIYNKDTYQDVNEDVSIEQVELDNNKKLELIKKVMDSGHNCYDKDTEVLTSNGFKYWKDVNYSDKLAVFNPKNGNLIGYEHPMKLIKEKYKGEMYHFFSSKVDLMVTPNHRLYCSLSNSVEKRLNPEFKIYQCNQGIQYSNSKKHDIVAQKPLRFMSACETQLKEYFNPLNLPIEKINSFCKFVGFFIGDGYIKNEYNKIQFHLKKQRKINYLQTICNDLNLTLEHKKHGKYCIKNDNLAKYCYYNLYSNKEKRIPNEILLCNKDNILALLDGLINSDGSISKSTNSLRYDSTSKQVADMYQILNTITGTKVILSKTVKDNDNWNDVYCLSGQKNNANKFPHFNDARAKNNYMQKVNYDDYIYCATVSTGLLMVRRGDVKKQITLSGNSTTEHAYFTFAISGVSRALLAQITRHRLCSFSVQSQRYVEIKENLEDLITLKHCGTSFDKDKLLCKYFTFKDDNDLFKEAYLDSLIAYEKLIKAGYKAEDARNVLPQGIKTNLVISCNLRELMHVCNWRLCKHAQLEVRTMVKKMKDEVISKNECKWLAKYLTPRCKVCTDFRDCKGIE